VPHGVRGAEWEYSTALNCTVLYCTILSCPVLSCTVLPCAVLYCSVLYCTVLSCAVLFCLVLYCPVLYCTVLYCPVLYCPVLYCPVLYCTVHFTVVSTFHSFQRKEGQNSESGILTNSGEHKEVHGVALASVVERRLGALLRSAHKIALERRAPLNRPIQRESEAEEVVVRGSKVDVNRF